MENIEDKKINTGLKEIKNIKMTSAEKNHIFQNILNQNATKPEPIRSPWSSFFFASNYSHYLKFAVFLIVILAGGGIIVSKNNPPKVEVSIIPNYYQRTNLAQNEPSNNSSVVKTQKITESSNTSQKDSIPVATLNQDTNNNTDASTAIGLNTSSLAPTSKNYAVESENYINIASTVFTKWFIKLAKEKGAVLDYKINNITFVAMKKDALLPEKSWFSNINTDEAFIVTVDFSVKTTEEGKNNFWLAGNGHDGPDGWVLNKSLFITIDKVNNIYSVTNAGTGM